jgi:hypothetical protein
MDASGLSGSAGSDSDGARDESNMPVVGRWPDGTAITETAWRAPEDARELSADFRGYARETRRRKRRHTLTGVLHTLGSPRGAVAVVLVAALIASAFAMLMPALR